MTLPAEPFQVLPPLVEEEFEALKTDIARRGIQVPIELDELGNVIDGHHRLRAWKELRAAGVRVPPYPRTVRRYVDDDERLEQALMLNLHRRHLTARQRASAAATLRSRGWSLRRIAAAAGVDARTVGRDLAGVAIATPDVVAGADGKRYQPVHRLPSISAHSAREEDRARVALEALGDKAPPGPLTLRRAETKVRALPREVPTERSHEGASWQVECADFRSLEMDEESIDLLVTDPPYEDASIGLFSDLGLFARQAVRPGGLVVSYTGTLRLPEVIGRLSEHLTYVWAAVVVQPGRSSALRARMIRSSHRTALIFANGNYEPRGWILDTIVSEKVPDKRHHRWEQGVEPVAALVDTCSRAGELVCDPMMGSGTTGVAACRSGRRFLGCDIDPAAVATAAGRLSEISEQ